jgi:hypothetical protein
MSTYSSIDYRISLFAAPQNVGCERRATHYAKRMGERQLGPIVQLIWGLQQKRRARSTAMAADMCL